MRDRFNNVVWSAALAAVFVVVALLTAAGIWSDWDQEDALVLVGCGIICAILSLRER
jgi:hypothetical protein